MQFPPPQSETIVQLTIRHYFIGIFLTSLHLLNRLPPNRRHIFAMVVHIRICDKISSLKNELHRNRKTFLLKIVVSKKGYVEKIVTWPSGLQLNCF